MSLIFKQIHYCAAAKAHMFWARKFISANFPEFQRVRLLAKPQFTEFFHDILGARIFWKKLRVRLFFNYVEVVAQNQPSLLIIHAL